MNIFKMNQIAFSQAPIGEPPQENCDASTLHSTRVEGITHDCPFTPIGHESDGRIPQPPTPVGVTRRRGRVFQVSKKPSNASIFLISLLTYLIGIFPSMVFALPTGGVVQAGSATIDSVSPQQITIQQTTEKAIIDWQTFGIESSEHVDFQLSQGGVTLNRVTGNNPSNIFGKLTSNGDLWLINPNGVLFGTPPNSMESQQHKHN